jgi:hypothetical protein
MEVWLGKSISLADLKDCEVLLEDLDSRFDELPSKLAKSAFVIALEDIQTALR